MWWKFRKTEKPSSPEKKFAKTEEANELRASGRAPLNEITRHVKEVELVTKKKTSTLLAGQYRSRFKGQGMQFSDFRVYQYGDDIRHIDWRTSARMQETYVKTFEEERELNIMFAVDVSASEKFGSSGLSKQESLAIALACIGFSAIANSDRVGLLLFSDRVERFVPPKKGRKHILRIINELLTFQPKSKGSKMMDALNFLSSTLHSGSVVILASDFFSGFDPKKIEILARKHDLVCMRAIDPRDTFLPNVGLIQIEDPETGESLILNTGSERLRTKYAKDQTALREAITQVLKKGGASLLDLPTQADPARVLHEFFLSRKRKKG